MKEEKENENFTLIVNYVQEIETNTWCTYDS